MPITQENAHERYNRFSEARNNLSTWKMRIKDIYAYVSPMRDDYDVPIHEPSNQNQYAKGQSATRKIFDSTAITAAKNFANNLQLTLVPPLTNWITLKVANQINGRTLSSSEKTKANAILQNVTETLFENIRASNFDLAFNEIAKDLSVGTAIMLVNESEGRAPFSFSAVDINASVFETGADDSIESIWLQQETTRRKLKQLFPMANFPQSFQRDLSDNPNKSVRFVIGSVIYPENPSNKRCLYYVQLEDNAIDILTEWRDISPFIGVRYEKRAGEAFGRGVADTSFPTIKTLNKAVEFMIRSAQWLGMPVFLINQASAINTYNLNLRPGARIPVNSDVAGESIKALDVKANPSFMQMLIQDLRAQVKQEMFADPLGPVEEVKGRSATEMQARLEKFIRENGAAAGRLAQELIFPVLDRGIRILKEKGIIKDLVEEIKGGFDISFDNKNMTVVYNSPMLQAQAQSELQNLSEYIQILVGLLGQGMLAVFDLPEMIFYIADKLNIENDLLRSKVQLKEIIDKLMQAIQGQAAQSGGTTTPTQLPQPLTPQQQ